MTKHWKYKAINHEIQIVEDVAIADNFLQLAYMLRQKHLQVIEATTISHRDYKILIKIIKARKITYKPPKPINDSILTKLITKLSRLFK